jgi:hypothetical protein
MPARRTIQSTDPRDWYQLQFHRRRAKFQLAQQPFCELCLKKGIARAANIADHLVPHAGNWECFRLGRLQSLCQECHSRDKALIERHGYDPRIDKTGFPTDRNHPVYGNEPKQPAPAIDIADLIS